VREEEKGGVRDSEKRAVALWKGQNGEVRQAEQGERAFHLLVLGKIQSSSSHLKHLSHKRGMYTFFLHSGGNHFIGVMKEDNNGKGSITLIRKTGAYTTRRKNEGKITG